MNNNFNNSNEPPKKNNVWMELLFGLCAQIALGSMMYMMMFTGKPSITILGEILLVVIGTVIAVKCIRMRHPIFATMLLLVIAPAVLIMLLAGSCAIMFGAL